LENIYKQL